MALQTRALTEHFGTEILEVDAKQLDQDDVAELMRIFDERLVVLFRGQDLSSEEQIEFAARLGPLHDLPDSALTAPGVQGKHIMVISNQMVDGRIGALPDGEMWFHFDQQYIASPPYAGVLFGMMIPPVGGNTKFSSAVHAYESLSDETKRRIASLHAVHVYDYRTTAGKVAPGDDTITYTHPVVIKQPKTGRPVLYVSPLMTYRIEELDQGESDELLQELFAAVEHADYTYEHVWAEGDLVIWDNNALLHARADFDPNQARMLRRLSLANQAPFEAFATT